MTPEQVQQVRQALRNRQLPSRTMAARLWDALAHVQNSKLKTPAGRPGRDVALTSSKTTGPLLNE